MCFPKREGNVMPILFWDNNVFGNTVVGAVVVQGVEVSTYWAAAAVEITQV